MLALDPVTLLAWLPKQGAVYTSAVSSKLCAVSSFIGRQLPLLDELVGMLSMAGMQGGKHSSRGGDPPSGGLPQLVSQAGDVPGSGSAGADERSSGASDQPGLQGEGGAWMQPGGGDSQHRQSLQRERCCWGPSQRKGGAKGEC